MHGLQHYKPMFRINLLFLQYCQFQ